MLKKGSLELSINAIVIIVLAFVLLGLGLGFIRTQIGKASELSSDIQKQVAEQTLKTLQDSGKKVAVQSSEVSVSLRERKPFGVGISNQEDSNLNYVIEVFAVKKEGSGANPTIKCDKALPTVSGDEANGWDITPGTYTGDNEQCTPDNGIVDVQFSYNEESNTLSPTDSKVETVMITKPNVKGLYIVKIRVINLDAAVAQQPAVYGQDTFFLNVV